MASGFHNILSNQMTPIQTRIRIQTLAPQKAANDGGKAVNDGGKAVNDGGKAVNDGKRKANDKFKESFSSIFFF
tara:strand:+ start:103 stop:324 length:222 start_codon:yes stop_codon:yes gene_type:complete